MIDHHIRCRSVLLILLYYSNIEFLFFSSSSFYSARMSYNFITFFMYSFCFSDVCVRVTIMQDRRHTVVAFSIVVVRENNKLSGLEEKQQQTGISIVHMFFIRFLFKVTCKTRHHHRHYEKQVNVFLEFPMLSYQDRNQRQHQQANKKYPDVEHHSDLI